jgi:HEPN domain-containing protein
MTDKEKQIAYWVSTAVDDLESIDYLFNGKKYVQALFFAHLSLEKILKALWVKNNELDFPPKTHNLSYLYENSKIALSEEQTDFLQTMNVYQIEGRYPDYISQLHNSTSKEKAETIINESKKLFQCLQEKLQ